MKYGLAHTAPPFRHWWWWWYSMCLLFVIQNSWSYSSRLTYLSEVQSSYYGLSIKMVRNRETFCPNIYGELPTSQVSHPNRKYISLPSMGNLVESVWIATYFCIFLELVIRFFFQFHFMFIAHLSHLVMLKLFSISEKHWH